LGSDLTAQCLDPGILGPPVFIFEEPDHPSRKLAGRRHPAGAQEVVEQLTPDVPPGPDLAVQLDVSQRAGVTVWLGDAASESFPVAGLP
jgi:hypothetical protein